MAFPPGDLFQPLATPFTIPESFPFPSISHLALIILKDADFRFTYDVGVPPHETMNPTSQPGLERQLNAQNLRYLGHA